MDLIKITRKLPGDNAEVLNLPTEAFVAKGDSSAWIARGWKHVSGSAPANGLIRLVKSNPAQRATTVTRYGQIAHIAFYKEQGWTIDTNKTYDGDVVKLTRELPGKPAVRLAVWVRAEDVPVWAGRNFLNEE